MSPIEALIKRLQKDVKAAALAEYRADQQKRTDLYCGNYEPHIRAELKTRLPKTADQLIPLWLNPYRKVVDERAGGLYRMPPVRVFLDANGQEVPDSDAMIDQIIDRKTLNTKLDKAARYLEAHRTILIAVVWRHNRIELDVLTPPLFHIVQGEPDPTCLEDAEAVAVHMSGCVSTPEKAEEPRSLIWYRGEDAEGGTGGAASYALFNDKTGKILDSGENPYWNLGADGSWAQVFPFVLMQAEDPDADIYIPGGDDLVRAALHIGFTLTDNEFVERFQSYGQPVFSGIGKETVAEMEIGPNSALALGAAGQEDFKFVAPPQTTVARMDSLGAFLRMLSYFYDLPVDTFDETRLPTSGTAMRISRKKLGQYRSDLAQRMAMFEERLFQTMRAVRNAMVGQENRTPWNFTYRVTPVPQEIPLDLTEQDARNTARIVQNLDSAVSIIARERGVTEERAREILTQNRQDNAQAGAFPGPALTSGAPGAGAPPGGGILDRMRARVAAAQAGAVAGPPGTGNGAPPKAPPGGGT
jgi:hypothetical protein